VDREVALVVALTALIVAAAVFVGLGLW